MYNQFDIGVIAAMDSTTCVYTWYYMLENVNVVQAIHIEKEQDHTHFYVAATNINEDIEYVFRFDEEGSYRAVSFNYQYEGTI